MKKLLALLLTLVMLLSAAPAVLADAGVAPKTAADRLHALELFNGVVQDAEPPVYQLEKQPTRCEAITMLIRLIGKEVDAKAGQWEMPFIDVPEWAEPYVGYAYAHGLTLGNSLTEPTFGGGPEDYVTAAQYLTFVLRALGYDSSVDFVWSEAAAFADEIGLTDGQYAPTREEPFLRADVAVVSWSALSAQLKAQTETLAETLVQDGVFTQEQYAAAESLVIEPEKTETPEPPEEDPYAPETICEKMLACKADYPEGMGWTNDDCYRRYGILGYSYYDGYGCVGFAMILSDAAFGEEAAYRQINAGSFTYDDLRVGDILRINNDTHTVIILDKNDTSLTIAEGNYNRSIHWGRTLPRATAEAANFIWTRYPES